MGIAIINLNDSSIQCQHGEVSVVAPGYALLTADGVVTGNEALHKSWLLPQQSHNQYWHQLNLSPLNSANNHARHHADLAYEQLQTLYREADKPDEIIIAIPGNFTADQLSILLGLAKASPFRAVGLVDAAVAATSQTEISGEVIHVDMQLHTSVITRITCGSQTARVQATQHPEISLKSFHNTWAQFIAGQFIREYRYDPLHTARGEQQLRDLLPGWLEQLQSAPEIAVELSAKQGDFRLNILRNELIAASSQHWQRLVEALVREKGIDAIFISHLVGELPGAKDYLKESITLPRDAVLKACSAHREHIISDQDNLPFVTALPSLDRSISRKDSASVAHQKIPTHVLHGYQAYAIGKRLNIGVTSDGLHIFQHRAATESEFKDIQNPVVLRVNEGKLALLHTDSSLQIQCKGDPDNLRVGNEITFGGETITLIEAL